MIDVNYLACLLWSYEMDEPHCGKYESHHYPKILEADLLKHLSEDHEGDCTGLPSPCNRCYAEHIVHKAEWLVQRIVNSNDWLKRTV